jgi:hypothetical protein
MFAAPAGLRSGMGADAIGVPPNVLPSPAPS